MLKQRLLILESKLIIKMTEKDKKIAKLYERYMEASKRQELGGAPQDTIDARGTFDKAMFDKYGHEKNKYLPLYRGF